MTIPLVLVSAALLVCILNAWLALRASQRETARLERRNAELEVEFKQTRIRFAQLKNACRVEGFLYEVKPEVPAQPARVVLKKAKG